jgi:hypothetical protein
VSGQVAELLVGSLCFAASTAIRIRVRDDLSVTTAAAIAPAVAVSAALYVDGGKPATLVLAPLLPSLVVMALARRPFREVVGHVVLYAFTAVSLATVTTWTRDSDSVVFAAVAGCVVYVGLDFLLQRVQAKSWEPLYDLRRMWALLHVVVISAAGLTDLSWIS